MSYFAQHDHSSAIILCRVTLSTCVVFWVDVSDPALLFRSPQCMTLVPDLLLCLCSHATTMRLYLDMYERTAKAGVPLSPNEQLQDALNLSKTLFLRGGRTGNLVRGSRQGEPWTSWLFLWPEVLWGDEKGEHVAMGQRQQARLYCHLFSTQGTQSRGSGQAWQPQGSQEVQKKPKQPCATLSASMLFFTKEGWWRERAGAAHVLNQIYEGEKKACPSSQSSQNDRTFARLSAPDYSSPQSAYWDDPLIH